MTDTNRRQEGEEVVLLVVNDVPGVPLLPLFWVAEPHSAGTEVAHATTARPRAAPERKEAGGRLMNITLRELQKNNSAPMIYLIKSGCLASIL